MAETPNTLDLGALGRRVDVADDGVGHRLDRAGAHALEGAEGDQVEHVRREAAERGAQQEHSRAGEEDTLAAVEIGEAPIDRDADRLEQEVDREHPAEEMEVAQGRDDRRHGGRHDGVLDRGHEGRRHAGRQDQAAPPGDAGCHLRMGGLRTFIHEQGLMDFPAPCSKQRPA
jgi:hypothetical protein